MYIGGHGIKIRLENLQIKCKIFSLEVYTLTSMKAAIRHVAPGISIENTNKGFLKVGKL